MANRSPRPTLPAILGQATDSHERAHADMHYTNPQSFISYNPRVPGTAGVRNDADLRVKTVLTSDVVDGPVENLCSCRGFSADAYGPAQTGVFVMLVDLISLGWISGPWMDDLFLPPSQLEPDAVRYCRCQGDATFLLRR